MNCGYVFAEQTENGVPLEKEDNFAKVEVMEPSLDN